MRIRNLDRGILYSAMKEKGECIMEIVKIRDEYIKLGQALKLAGLSESGVDAKYAIQDGLVKVNGQTEYQRGRKLHHGDQVEYDGQTIRIEA